MKRILEINNIPEIVQIDLINLFTKDNDIPMHSVPQQNKRYI